MQPIGHIAGIGSAILGFLSTIVTFAVATLIGQFVDTTAAPIFIGLLGCCLIGILLTQLIKEPQKEE